ncbi:hypothetical protein AGMMS49975_22500 [Clostridia bacterium]|nr:hypothetical protein AGMMS49975_22500 [Clostridia bacterium]
MKRLPPDIKRRILSNLVDIVLGDEPDELEICEQVILELIVEQVERAATLSEKNAKNGRKRTNVLEACHLHIRDREQFL